MSGRIGEKYVCQHCGVEQIRTVINQQICNECRNDESYKRRYENNKKYYRLNYTSYNIMEEVSYVKPEYSLVEVAAAAKKHNMSYGKYVSAWDDGTVEPPEKFPEKPKKRGRKKKNER